jgi:class 3 adenylate cyclase
MVADQTSGDRVKREQSRSTDASALDRALLKIEVLEKAKARLSQFVPRSVRRIIEEDPESPVLSKQERDVSILFLDVEGYTALSDRLAPGAVDAIIERYFSVFVDTFYEQGGDVNETAGDGLMVVFQDPDPEKHASCAARAALCIQDRTQAINQRGRDNQEPLVINIGISSGAASVGPRRFAGVHEIRCAYTATGPVTNRAARLQAEARAGAVLVSDETARRIHSGFELAYLGDRRLRNVVGSVGVYRLLNARHGT